MATPGFMPLCVTTHMATYVNTSQKVSSPSNRDYLFTIHGHDGGHLFDHVHVSFAIYKNKGSGCKQLISIVTIKFISQRNLLVI